jgi:hypothetical protein
MKTIVWAAMLLLTFMYVSPVLALVLGFGHIAFFLGAWYVAMRMLGVLK